MNPMAALESLLQGAEGSSFGLKKLNVVLQRVIPFNRPHRVRVVSVSESQVETMLPYRKSNLNHLKGVHACAIATLAEYTSGLYLLRKVGSSGYRLIMKSIHVEYHYQAKTDIFARFGMDDAVYRSTVIVPLERDGLVLEHFKVEVHDAKDNHIATATMEWQLKDWKKTSA